jgi:hypothetical protein
MTACVTRAHGAARQASARAAAQARCAAEWWLQTWPAAPGAVANDLGESNALLAEQPGIGDTCEGARTPGVRRLYLGRIGDACVQPQGIELARQW